MTPAEPAGNAAAGNEPGDDMSADVTDQVTEAAAGPVDPGARGHTTVAPAVVERIATRVASEVPGVRAESVSTLRSWFGTNRDPRGRPEVSADADLSTGHVELQLTLGVEWPRPVVATANATRRAVATAVRRLTGIHVGRIDIEVPDLPGRPSPVRVQ
jgi:uncharacterized alkaline shock family protein YloU